MGILKHPQKMSQGEMRWWRVDGRKAAHPYSPSCGSVWGPRLSRRPYASYLFRETLRLTWQRHYEQTGEPAGQRQVKWKAEQDLAPAHTNSAAISSTYSGSMEGQTEREQRRQRNFLPPATAPSSQSNQETFSFVEAVGSCLLI